ncbi:MAG: hypothetical protein HFG72_10550 [Hungatella sp.]|jgi:hypothetical protein|nr:hypothetical protein [Hungatella sp.]
MKRRNTLKLTLTALAMIGAGSILFYAAAETSLDARAGQAETVPTSYQVPNSLPPALPESGEKDTGAQTVNYHISMDDLNTETPTDVDLTMEEAAKTGAQYLKNIYGLDLEGAYVYMMYYSGTQTFPRAFWSGDVLFEKAQTPESTRWTYIIDAVTGELFDIGYGRKLDANPPLGIDQSLANDYSLYAQLAKAKVEECRLMDSPIVRVDYNCQGYSVNDPTITVDVIGQKGEIVNMTYSRYDQAFLGVITDTSRRISESALEDLAEEAEHAMAE